MKITYELLKNKGACPDALEEFKELNLDGIEVYDLIKLLHDRKDHKGYTRWLFEEFKLTGECIGYYDNGEVYYIKNYKNGERHGKCIWYHYNGEVRCIENYKNGKEHGECKVYHDNGEVECIENYKNGVTI
jgi:antitoxin component YwqK of YwqJK toxin-antitoxin module